MTLIICTLIMLVAIIIYLISRILKLNRLVQSLQGEIVAQNINLKKMIDQQMRKFVTANVWIKQLLCNQTIKEIMEKKCIDKIVIYGVTDLGMRLLEACLKENINVVAITDKRIQIGEYKERNIPFVEVSKLKKVMDNKTGVIITSVAFYEEIKNELSSYEIRNVLSLRDFLN